MSGPIESPKIMSGFTTNCWEISVGLNLKLLFFPTEYFLLAKGSSELFLLFRFSHKYFMSKPVENKPAARSYAGNAKKGQFRDLHKS